MQFPRLQTKVVNESFTHTPTLFKSTQSLL